MRPLQFELSLYEHELKYVCVCVSSVLCVDALQHVMLLNTINLRLACHAQSIVYVRVQVHFMNYATNIKHICTSFMVISNIVKFHNFRNCCVILDLSSAHTCRMVRVKVGLNPGFWWILDGLYLKGYEMHRKTIAFHILQRLFVKHELQLTSILIW